MSIVEIKAGQKWCHKHDAKRILRVMAVAEGYCMVRIIRAAPHIIDSASLLKYYELIK